METFSSDRLTAVVDSNVLIDVDSIHNLTRPPKEGQATLSERRARAKDALLLAICFHEMRAKTYSLCEAVDVLVRTVKPGSGGIEEHFVTCGIYFVRPLVLSRWTALHPPEVNLRGNAADAHFLAKAKEFGKPLITLEAKLTARARAVGVAVFRPAEFYAGRMDRDDAVRRFLLRFRVRARPFRKKRPGIGLVDAVLEFYEDLLTA
jgi:hypothetical protein